MFLQLIFTFNIANMATLEGPFNLPLKAKNAGLSIIFVQKLPNDPVHAALLL